MPFSIFSNPARDAQKIQSVVDYRILKAAWDGYAQINVGSLCSTHKIATPAWYALFSIQNYEGDFNKFDVDDLHLLKSLTSVNNAYDKIIKSLEKNCQNVNLGRHILTTHPNLQNAVPVEYDNAEKINSYIVNVIKQYQDMLTDFYKRHQKKIDRAVKKIEKDGELNYSI